MVSRVRKISRRPRKVVRRSKNSYYGLSRLPNAAIPRSIGAEVKSYTQQYTSASTLFQGGTTAAGFPIDNYNPLTATSIPAAGTAGINRIGNRIKIVAIEVSGEVIWTGGLANADIARMAIYVTPGAPYQHRASVTDWIGQVFAFNTASYSYLFYELGFNGKVLMDRRSGNNNDPGLSTLQVAGTTTTSGFRTETLNKYIKTNIDVEWDSVSGALATGEVMLITMGDNTNSATCPFFIGQVRIRFMDT